VVQGCDTVLTAFGGCYAKARRNLRPRIDRQADRREPSRRLAPDRRAAGLGGQRRKFDVIMAWAIDRLGRSLIDLLGTIQTLEACAVDLYLDQQSIDTTTPAGKLMFQVCGAFGEFERSMIRQRIKAGLKRAVAQGRQLGRPRIDPAIEKRIQAHLRGGKGIRKVARECGVGTGTVQRVKQEMESPFVGAAA
jgi:DNA invertase Pin-like site-specific DNA recombinase